MGFSYFDVGKEATIALLLGILLSSLDACEMDQEKYWVAHMRDYYLVREASNNRKKLPLMMEINAELTSNIEKNEMELLFLTTFRSSPLFVSTLRSKEFEEAGACRRPNSLDSFRHTNDTNREEFHFSTTHYSASSTHANSNRPHTIRKRSSEAIEFYQSIVAITQLTTSEEHDFFIRKGIKATAYLLISCELTPLTEPTFSPFPTWQLLCLPLSPQLHRLPPSP